MDKGARIMIISSSSCTNHFHDINVDKCDSLALLLRIVLGILWRLQTCQRHRESSSLYFLDFPTVQLMLQSIPNVPRESQNVCLVELFSILMLSFHISEQKDRQQVSKQTFLFFQICQKQQFNMSQKCIRSWKMYLQSLTIIDFPTLCANQMCAKKWVEESFIINLWKQRLVLAFFLPSSSLLGCDLLVLANICLALRNVTILWQGKVAYNRHHVCFETYKDEMPFLHYSNEWPTSWGKFAFEKWFSFK